MDQSNFPPSRMFGHCEVEPLYYCIDSLQVSASGCAVFMLNLINMLIYSKINLSDCVDMECDGFKNAIIIDEDGSLLGSGNPGTVIPQVGYINNTRNS